MGDDSSKPVVQIKRHQHMAVCGWCGAPGIGYRPAAEELDEEEQCTPDGHEDDETNADHSRDAVFLLPEHAQVLE